LPRKMVLRRHVLGGDSWILLHMGPYFYDSVKSKILVVQPYVNKK
jgi:hypothetical protein